MKKRILSIFLLVLTMCLLGIMPACSSESSLPTVPIKGIGYAVSSDGTYATATSYTGKDTEVLVADTYNGVPVKYINKNCFKNKKVDTLVIPDSVVEIMKDNFSGCSFKRVVIGNGISVIAESAFENCLKLRKVVLPKSVKVIKDSAFSGCARLSEINIPDYVLRISHTAFNNCKSLLKSYKGLFYVGDASNPYKLAYQVGNKNKSSYNLHENTNVLGNSLFVDCVNLEELILPNGLTSICVNVFTNCKNLKYNREGYLSYLGSENNKYLYLAKLDNPNAFSANINKNCKIIGDNAFIMCTSLTSIEIGEKVSSIGVWAFGSCRDLEQITIGENVKIIGDYAFNYCGLKSLSIPNSVVFIGENAFDSCQELTSVDMGVGIKYIETYAFYCPNLKNITYKGTKEDWNNVFKEDYGIYSFYLKNIKCANGEIKI